MARGLDNLPNRTAHSTKYPHGQIADNDGTGNGTPVNQFTNDDFFQFFDKLLRMAGISASGVSENETDGFQYIAALQDFVGDMIATAVALINAKNPDGLIRKVVNIGDWNMDSTAAVSVAHGLPDVTKIRAIDAQIFDDASNIYPLVTLHNITGAGGNMDGWIYGAGGGSSIALVRLTGGFFDSTSFDSTSFNRGFVVITYAP